MSAAKVPHIVKHMTLAIWRSGDISGGKRQRFVSAWNIARSRLAEYGYLTQGSVNGKSSNIKLTSKGSKREAHHRNEPGGKAKSAVFDEMFAWIEAAEGALMQEGESQTDGSQSGRTTLEKDDQDAAIVGPRLNLPKKPNPPFKPKK